MKKISLPYYVMNRNKTIEMDVTGHPLVHEGPVSKKKLKNLTGYDLPVLMK